ncbi:MAG: tetratricopeptide repeat protein, partial [Gammaproteobacteria bacterium]
FAEARQLYARRDFRNADEAIQAILKQQPMHIQARTLYATTLINRGDIESAMQTLDGGLALNPGISEWADIYARLLVNMGRNEEAVEVLSRAMPNISHHDYYAFYAALLQRLSRHEEASEFYRTLLKQNPDNGLWWMGLGISLDAMAYRDSARQAFESALQGQNLDYELRQYVLQQIERLSG